MTKENAVTRIPITRHDPDGTIVDGTALLDFRDLDGQPMPMPEGAHIEFDMDDLAMGGDL